MIYSEDIPYNNAFGYATKDQIAELNRCKDGLFYWNLKKQIEFQNKHKGKVKGKSFNSIGDRT